MKVFGNTVLTIVAGDGFGLSTVVAGGVGVVEGLTANSADKADSDIERLALLKNTNTTASPETEIAINLASFFIVTIQGNHQDSLAALKCVTKKNGSCVCVIAAITRIEKQVSRSFAGDSSLDVWL